MKISSSLSLSVVLLTSMITPIDAFGKFSFDSVYALFGKYRNETVIEKEYRLENPDMLIISNINGDINITTEWKRDTISLKAIKKAAKPEELTAFSIKAKREDRLEGEQLSLTTVCNNKQAKGAVHYHLIVPANIKLNLRTEHGSVTVNDVNGPITVNTLQGNIELKNVSNTVTAQTEESGSILIEKAKGNIKATTAKGNITIDAATKSVIASTQKGNITTACNNVPATSRIVLNTQNSGGITLALPTSVNATLQGKTTRGKLTSDHYVTIKPFTTKLNRQSLKNFGKNVDGILGTGEADIQLTSNSGNIKILEIKTT